MISVFSGRTPSKANGCLQCGWISSNQRPQGQRQTSQRGRKYTSRLHRHRVWSRFLTYSSVDGRMQADSLYTFPGASLPSRPRHVNSHNHVPELNMACVTLPHREKQRPGTHTGDRKMKAAGAMCQKRHIPLRGTREGQCCCYARRLQDS